MTKAALTRQVLCTLFSSMTRDGRQWNLTRTLKSDNPMEINGVLRGTASFVPIRGSINNENGAATADTERNVSSSEVELVYREEGKMPPGALAGLRWTKKYIWRLGDEGSQISIWFVKVGQQEEEVADYLFHNFDFKFDGRGTDELDSDDSVSLVTPPLPPSLSCSGAAGKDPDSNTIVLTAYGDHLCVKDMYYTAYAFRIRPTGEVVSWSSRHVVKGPKKNQDIVNLYEKGV